MDVSDLTETETTGDGLRTLSVEGLRLVGTGGNSRVFDLGDGTVVKVFNEGLPYDMVAYEYTHSKLAHAIGVPSAATLELVRANNSYGIVYERLKGSDLLSLMAGDKRRLQAYVRSFADRVRAMHALATDTTGLGDAKETFRGYLARLEGRLCTADEVGRLMRVCEEIPDRTTFVHGDCHPGNVILRGDELVFFDLSSCGHGHPILDVVGMCSIFLLASLDDARRQSLTLTRDFTCEECRLIWDTFLSAYLETQDASMLTETERQVVGFARIRHLLRTLIVADEDLPTYEDAKQKALAFADGGLGTLCF